MTRATTTTIISSYRAPIISQLCRRMFSSSVMKNNPSRPTTSTTSSSVSRCNFSTSQQEDEEEEVEDTLESRIRGLLRDNKVVLFMKGNPNEPECGFSNQVVQVLEREKYEDYTFVDVLKSEDVRDTIKEMSDWPTIPQLFIDGEFVGGADVVLEMHADGSLKKLLADGGEEA